MSGKLTLHSSGVYAVREERIMSHGGTPSSSPANRKPQVSQTAIYAAVSSLILCCPLTSMAGVVLGVFAIRSIRASNGRLTGTRYAVIGIVLGMIGPLLQLAALQHLVVNIQDQQQREVISVVEQLFLEPAARPQVLANSDDPATLDVATAFVDEALARYGPLRGVSIIGRLRPEDSSLQQAVLVGPIMLRFEARDRLGAVRVSVRAQPGSVMPVHRLLTLSIEDRELGDLHLHTDPPEFVADSPPNQTEEDETQE